MKGRTSIPPHLIPAAETPDSREIYKLSRGVWESYDDIVQACCDAWNWFIADTVRVASITTRK